MILATASPLGAAAEHGREHAAAAAADASGAADVDAADVHAADVDAAGAHAADVHAADEDVADVRAAEADAAEADAAASVLAPGWQRLDYAAPEPGTYELPPLGRAGDGEVLDGSGRALRLHAAFGDDVVVLGFVYTSCPDINGCPLAHHVMQRLQGRLLEDAQLAGRVRLVSLSFDPLHDRPEVMRRLGESFAREGADWRFLTTASEAALSPILDAYGQSVQREVDAEGRPLGTISHVLRVFLIDRKKRIRNVYSSSLLHSDTVWSDVRTILGEEEGGPAGSASAPTRAGGAAGVPSEAASAAAAGREASREEGREESREEGRGESREERAHAARSPAAPPLGLPALRAPRYTTRDTSPTRDVNPTRDVDPSRDVEPTRGTQPTRGTPPTRDTEPARDEEPTPERIALGRKLFFDRRLSRNATVSCALCHVPSQGFTSNAMATAVGIEGRTVRRNAPTLYNVAWAEKLFHDGRESSLEEQVWSPLLAADEMGNESADVVIERLRSLPDYDGAFEAAFDGQGPTRRTVGAALASWQRTLIAANSPFDRWRYGGKADALSPAARRGFALFTGAAGCAGCHTIGTKDALFTDHDLHATGVGFRRAAAAPPREVRLEIAGGGHVRIDPAVIAAASEPPVPDLGLFEVTGRPGDRWKYRTPSLRNVALTAPYMHDGSIATLPDVVEFYDGGGVAHDLLDERIRALGLSVRQKEDLVAFLESLTGDDVEAIVRDAEATPIGDPGRFEVVERLPATHGSRASARSSP